ncbi:hypothetical protein V3C99_001214 [Haemonchus contortus]|uniref:Uncharacterized protein n=1 Tax=Haemonchus contortus TaxID=6289 RepID=A0A7I4YCY1_HAECO
MLKSSLMVIVYLDVAISITSLLCLKRKPKAKSSISSSVSEPQQRPSSRIQPRQIELTEKERLIKSGLQTGRQAYPTLDDIVSDWSEKEESKDDKKGSSEAGKGSKGSAEDKPKADPVAKAGEKKVKDGVQ